MLRHSRQHLKPLCMVFVDLAKAFDSEDHIHIKESLRRFRIDESFIDVIVDMYTNVTATFMSGRGGH